MSATLLASAPVAAPPAADPLARARWAGRVVSAFAALFLLFDSALKLIPPVPAVVDGMHRLGWPLHLGPPLGVILLACTALYLVPRTAILGAVLLTGYLGGAIAAHLRVGDPLFAQVLFPVYFAAFIWGGLYLRDARVRALFCPAR